MIYPFPLFACALWATRRLGGRPLRSDGGLAAHACAAGRERIQLMTPPASRSSHCRGDRSCRRRNSTSFPGRWAAISRLLRTLSCSPENRISSLDTVVVCRVGEGERQDPEVDEVLPMDPREGLRDHHPQAEVARGERCVLAARALTVVVGPDHRVAAALARPGRPLRIGLVDRLEHELADLGDVAAKRQGPPARRHDLVGGDVGP